MAPVKQAIDADQLVQPAIDLVRSWLVRASELESRADRKTMSQLEGVVTDADGVAFVMRFVDRVIRPDDDAVAAAQLKSVVGSSTLPDFLTPIDKLLLRAGAVLGPKIPRIVMPLARRRMRSIVGHLVAPAERSQLKQHLAVQRAAGYALNVNLLGEAVLGEREAERRLQELLDLLDQPDIDYVSVKISAVASQLNHFAFDDSLRRVTERLRLLIDKAATVTPPTFINFDMEEYHDLDLTVEAFMDVLSDDRYQGVDAGIVLQAYLPDALPVLQRLVEWANIRRAEGGGEVKVRLVKGANLAMEKVDAAIHGWEQTPFATKVEADANYKRCLDWLLTPEHLIGVRLGLASHNLFDIAWTHLLSEERGVAHRVQFEMLQGMAPAQAATVDESTDPTTSLLLYTPAVRHEDFDVAISYLFRRLEENASEDNFMRHLFDLSPGSAAFEEQAELFSSALATRDDITIGARRSQNRNLPPEPAYAVGDAFVNEPETDPTLPANRAWIDEICTRKPRSVDAELTTTIDALDRHLSIARQGAASWSVGDLTARRAALHRVADELALRRADLITTMMHEANKTFAEADGEVAEAIDFARWYGDRAVELDGRSGVAFTPLGIIGVVPPWNFPVAIPTGGVLAALAAGNAVILKPAPETPRCAEIVAEAIWSAGIPKDAMLFVRTPDDDVGKHLVTNVDAVILTGAAETAELFASWKLDLKLFAETSGKNVLIITPNADIDLAVDDLVKSAFGHSGQKCSAASLAILVGDVYESPRFRRQLVDAVESLTVGPATEIVSNLGPLIGPANDRLQRGLTELDHDEEWLIRPRLHAGDDQLWSPGVRIGVTEGSWYHQTECFGPVLGLMRAATLSEAIDIANSSDYGLTGGIHTLDPDEVDQWKLSIEVGNGYVNRPITGAIVQRQPFGGWKRSSVGPGAKAGGPNYVAQLGTWTSTNTSSPENYADVWARHFVLEHDPTGLFCEANVFRYRPLDRIGFRIGPLADPRDVERVRGAANVCGVELVVSNAQDETQIELAARLDSIGVERLRIVGEETGIELRVAANAAHVHIADDAVMANGRIELLHFVREQAISTTLHRFGNLLLAPEPPEMGSVPRVT
ncbi:MAG: RHH-type proline utilization regulon transcriptional repressor/proline dehydrogenase [Verrucomicrobiales bacterium]|jgi:RHH-type proline utilization regulon transcriptional repressor/proline dehydrogenase/delta 1-pyrroline-5-carboxylate dehydrogenase